MMSATMRAICLKGGFGLDKLCLEERPQPEVGAGQALVRMRAVSLNYRDLLIVRGEYDPKLKLPLVPCSDGAGEVVSIGSGVTRVRAGDRVCPIFARGWLSGPPTRDTPRSALGGPLDGTLVEYFLADAESLVPVPAHLSDVEAATLPCAAVTAWRALIEEGGLQPGQSVLVLGTGGVSTFALAFAKLAGARVIVTSRDGAKLERARELGADETLDLGRDPEFGVRVRKLTGELGVDHVVEVGGAGTLGQSLRAVRAGGSISLIGVAAGGTPPSLIPAVMRNVRLQGVFVGPRSSFEAMNRALEAHAVRPALDRTFALEEFAAAFEQLASGRHFGKVCITC
ncbi:MAG TPA: NAD(P)-dependent alcohol dehydrogenase [Polyangiaceae bacterium]|nr:NAD(P)-dependent alcohol dehydrogenase [Polyangiaceae bacterium]